MTGDEDRKWRRRRLGGRGGGEKGKVYMYYEMKSSETHLPKLIFSVCSHDIVTIQSK